MENIVKDFSVLGGDLTIQSKSADDEVIQNLSRITGVVYSDEQLAILKHHGGMAIMAAAGSGKTTVLTHLLVKRIMSGEIQDVTKVLCATYSKAGADEMAERINKLLDVVGIKKHIMVKTMHAFYLLILQHFGYSLKLIENAQRTKFIRDACSKVNVKLNDDDMQTLDSLLSYQVNNLLSDKGLFDSYVYTLQDVSMEQYSKIKAWYTELKRQAGMMDFDDMQLYVYFWLCVADENTKKTVTDYIHQTWQEFYIDEAQDLSKIQMAILRKMCTDSSKIVFIGDDDQCLIEGTKVSTPKGLVNIEDIHAGDEVWTKDKSGESCSLKEASVVHTSRKYIKSKIVTIKTVDGKVVSATPEHIAFIGADNFLDDGHSVKFDGEIYREINFGNLSEGMYISSVQYGTIVESEIDCIEVADYEGYVYDISIPETHNFVANGILVHNCIYEWRGADPSLLINITGYYDIERFILSTNYRCRAEIVDTAAVGIKHNARRTVKTMKPFNSGGEIKIIDTTYYNSNGDAEAPDLYQMTKYAFMYIRDLIKSGVSPSDIAVLSRNNGHLAILNNMLFREGIYSMYTKDMKFTGNSMYKELKQILELARDDYDPDLTEKLLWKVVPYLSAKSAKLIAKFQESSGFKFSDTLGWFLTECCNMSLGWKLPSGSIIPESSKTSMRALARSLNTSQASNIRVMYRASVYDGSTETDPDKRRNENEYRRVCNFMGLYSQVSLEFLYRTADKQRACKGYIEYFKKMVKDWGIEKTLRFLNVSQQYELGVNGVFCEKINMSTMHGAKGKEWSHVVLFADDNISFPNFRSIRDLKARGISTSDIYKVIEEDRRLHYVAMTRAKNTLAIVTYKNNISVYTLEAFGILNDCTSSGGNNDSILGMAMCDKVRLPLIESAKKKLFDKNCKYYLDIDVSKIEDAPDIEFYGTADDPPGTVVGDSSNNSVPDLEFDTSNMVELDFSDDDSFGEYADEGQYF